MYFIEANEQYQKINKWIPAIKSFLNLSFSIVCDANSLCCEKNELKFRINFFFFLACVKWQPTPPPPLFRNIISFKNVFIFETIAWNQTKVRKLILMSAGCAPQLLLRFPLHWFAKKKKLCFCFFVSFSLPLLFFLFNFSKNFCL